MPHPATTALGHGWLGRTKRQRQDRSRRSAQRRAPAGDRPPGDRCGGPHAAGAAQLCCSSGCGHTVATARHPSGASRGEHLLHGPLSLLTCSRMQVADPSVLLKCPGHCMQRKAAGLMPCAHAAAPVRSHARPCMAIATMLTHVQPGMACVMCSSWGSGAPVQASSTTKLSTQAARASMPYNPCLTPNCQTCLSFMHPASISDTA